MLCFSMKFVFKIVSKGGHFEKSAVLPLYSTKLAMVPKLILKSIKCYVRKCWFRRVPGGAGRPPLHAPLFGIRQDQWAKKCPVTYYKGNMRITGYFHL